MKPWLNESLQQFQKIVASKRIPHALILYGNQNIGKLELAQKIVEELTKVNVENDNLDIDVNNNKISIRQSNYNSLIYCQREIPLKSKVKDKKRSNIISVNQIRKFCDFLGKTSNKLQIGIINYGDFLHNSASNALLKTLEEPKKRTLIIILAHNIKTLPATILSRCQKIHIMADDDSINWIKDKISINIDDLELQKIFKECDFVPNTVVEKINNGDYQQELQWRNELISMALNPNNINKLSSVKNNETKIISCLQNLIIESIELKSTIKNNDKLTTDNTYNHILQKTDVKMLFGILRDVSQVKSLLNTTMNKPLVLDNLLIIWSHITHLQQYPHTFNKNINT